MLTWTRRNPKTQKRQIFPQKSLQLFESFKPQHMQHVFPTSSATWPQVPKWFHHVIEIISDIFLDSQSAMLLPLDPSQCIVNLLSTLRRKSQYDATVLCFGSSVTIKWQPTQSETKKLIPTKFHKNSVQFNACFYSSSFFENAEFHHFGRLERVEAETPTIWHSQPSSLQHEFPSCSPSCTLGNV